LFLLPVKIGEKSKSSPSVGTDAMNEGVQARRWACAGKVLDYFSSSTYAIR
jgi:hypothetical protein